MSKVSSVKALRAKRAKRLAQKRGLPPNKGSSYHRPWRTTTDAFHNSLKVSLYEKNSLNNFQSCQLRSYVFRDK